MKKNIIKIVAISFLLLSTQGIAATDNLDFKVKIAIYQKLCTVNDNKPITVDFKDMIISEIDGVKYQEPIKFTLTCEDSADNPALKVRFENNTGASFDNTLLRTSDIELGIRIDANGNKLNLGEWAPFKFNDLDSQLKLTATPVPSGRGGINDGLLTASALLTVEYE